MIKRLAIFTFIVFVVLMSSLNASAAQPAPLEKAKDFELKGLDNKTYRLSDLKGKVVLINFWATWCKYCVKENPSLDRLYNKFKDDGLVVLGISVDRSPSVLKNFLQKHPLSYPVLIDTDGKVFVKTYTVLGLPTSFLINKEGYIIEKLTGGQDFASDKFMQKIKALL